jgi:HK97 family phage portal protein
MTVKLLDSGRRGYLYRSIGKEPIPLTQDEVFHVMGMSLDGVTGCSVIEYARESIGRSLAEEAYAARFWSQGAATRGALVTDAKLDKEARNRNQEAWQEAQGGWWNSHKVAMLEGGLKWEQIGVSARDAQYIEGREFSVSDIARWFGVPPHMIGDVERSTSWGTGIEQQSIGFLQTTMEPWYTLWEQEIDRQLLEDDDDLFSEFLRDALLRADLEARTSSHRQYVDGGILSVNEVRDQLNLNPIEGEAYEKPLRAENIGGGGDPAAPAVQRRGGGEALPEPVDDDADARARGIVLRAATRVVGKEIGAIQKWAPRYAANPIGWREWVADFYGKFVPVLGEALGIDEQAARRYGAAHTAELLERGIAVLEEWDRHAPAALTAMALGEAVVIA